MKALLLIPVLLIGVSVAPRANAQDPSAACIEQMRDDPKLQALWVKYPFDPSKGQSLEVLSNPNRPNANERAALSFFASEGERCFDLGADWRKANYPAEVNALLATFRVDALSAMADLYAGKITFGEMAKTRARLASDLISRVQAVVGKLQADRATEERRRRDVAEQRAYAEAQARQQQEAVATQQAEMARRQALLQILSRSFQPIQLPPPPKTVITNCSGAGNSFNCISR